MPHPDPLQRLAELDTNTVSDALDVLQLPGAVVGIRTLWDCPTVVGRASTVKLAPKTDAAPGVHLISPVIDAITGDDRVLVIAGGIDGVSCWGDIMTQYAGSRGVAATVIDGVCRDVSKALGDGYPMFTRGRYMRTGKDRVQVASVNQPVAIGGARVCARDIVVADANGVLVVPRDRAEAVARTARQIEHAKSQIRAQLEAGKTLKQAREALGYHQLQRKDS